MTKSWLLCYLSMYMALMFHTNYYGFIWSKMFDCVNIESLDKYLIHNILKLIVLGCLNEVKTSTVQYIWAMPMDKSIYHA